MAELELNVKATGAVSGSKQAEDGLRRTGQQAQRTERQLKGVSGAAATAGRTLGRLGAVAAGVFSVHGAVKAINSYRDFNKAVSEVSTLIPGTRQEIKLLEREANSLAKTFGGTATQQVQAFYQAISAGVGDVGDAASFLEDANRLAVAGVTDVETAVDLLTTTLNAWGDANMSASEASDVLFTAVRQGKTTIDELTASLGRIAPTADAMGISLEEIAAATATMTARGIQTSEAMSGLKAALANIAKPTSDAQKVAEALGIEFNLAALESKGFAEFMQDMIDKTGGSTTAISALFGSVEAFNAVMALAGDGGDLFLSNLEEEPRAAV